MRSSASAGSYISSRTAGYRGLALDGQIDQTSLDVDLLHQLLAFQSGSNSGVSLGGGNGSGSVDVG